MITFIVGYHRQLGGDFASPTHFLLVSSSVIIQLFCRLNSYFGRLDSNALIQISRPAWSELPVSHILTDYEAQLLWRGGFTSLGNRQQICGLSSRFTVEIPGTFMLEGYIRKRRLQLTLRFCRSEMKSEKPRRHGQALMDPGFGALWIAPTLGAAGHE